MKKLLLAFSLIACCAGAHAQITITASDMPVPTGSFNIADMTTPGIPTGPVPGTNIHWDFGDYNGSPYTEDYFAETDTFFTNAGIDVNYPMSKSMVQGAFGYKVTSELDFSAAGVSETGVHISYQGFDLSIATGNMGDSMEIPEQKYHMMSPVQVMKFPLTAGTAWHSSSRRSTDFTLTVSPVYDHTPSRHAYWIHRDDSVAGWGKLRVYAATGPGAWYDVLMDKIAYYTTDSIYINGAPASSTFLATFGMTQGQHTDSGYRYEFYRKTSFNYLARFNYYNDAGYNSLSKAYYNTDNIDPSSVGALSHKAFSTLLYPNPVAGDIVNFKIVNGDIRISGYIITDITGKIVASGDAINNEIHADASGFGPGLYILSACDDKGKQLTKEEFQVIR